MRLLVDVAREAGITYRQADHWCACRYIRADFYTTNHGMVVPSKSKGSGRQRRLTDEESHVLHVMARLVRAGIQPASASELARTQSSPYRLGGGVYLVMDHDHRETKTA